MKLYFGAAISLDRSMLPVYQTIVSTLKELGHEVLSEYVVDPDLKPGAGLSPEKLFERETKTIEQADAMIAEVSSASWGTAFLMEHALEHGKPVLALYYKDKEQPLPMMIAGHPELYVQHYSEDNLKTLLKRQMEHFSQSQKREGKLVVIDGTDGSGKGTQTQKLLEYLSEEGVPNKYIDFPRYYTSFHGQMVGRLLAGEFGKKEDSNPYLVSLTYALDRLTARDEIADWLAEGNTVVANRYTTSSFAFQGARVPEEEREGFWQWLYDMEYKEHRLPKEDVVLFLYVPVEISQQLLLKKAGEASRNYLKGKKKDINEADIAYQKKVLDLYFELAKKFDHWELIKCVDDKDELLSIEAVHQKVLEVLRRRKLI